MALLFSKCTSVFVVFVLMVLCKSQATSSKPNESSIAKRHGQWTTRYGKVYNSIVEKDKRYKIFKANVQFIDSFNSKRNQPYKLAINAFADLTNEEFLASRTGLKRSSKPKPLTSFKYENVTDVPPTMDWRSKGAVTPIKDQGDCGSCWAFSTVAAVEGINQLTTGKLIELSEQELVDCDTEDYGCRGGTLETAFEFIQQNGIANETLYPYEGDDDNTCNKEAASSIAAKISGYESVPENSESELLKAVANQPIAAAIDGSGHAFQFYSTGVFTRDCGTKIYHGVAVVGYGTTNDGIKYWLVKNSWGTGWGQEGYILMERDVSISEGLCGIAIEPVYPTA